MLNTFKEIIQENWQWRNQIFNLALFDVRKSTRGAALGWIWIFVKPLTYIGVFWFALSFGLRAGDNTAEYPYILWLTLGLIPWFFMQSMIGTGANVYRRYPFLVNRIKFPLSSISTFYTLAQFIIFLLLMALVLVVAFIGGVDFSIHALQLIPVSLCMLVYFIFFSILLSPLSAMSKDFNNLLKALSTPLFWISGIIYNVMDLPIPALHTILAFNPITFFATASRASLCEKYWVWEKPEMLIPFLIVFALTVLLAVRNYKHLGKDVADVL